MFSSIAADYGKRLSPAQFATIRIVFERNKPSRPEVLDQIKKSADDLIEKCKEKNANLMIVWKKHFSDKSAEHKTAKTKWEIEPGLEEAALEVILAEATRVNDLFLRMITEHFAGADKAYIADLLDADKRFSEAVIIGHTDRTLEDLQILLDGIKEDGEEQLQRFIKLKSQMFKCEWVRKLLVTDIPAMKRLIETPFHKTVLAMFHGHEIVFDGDKGSAERFQQELSS